MSENIPKWIDDLALRVCKLIQKYDAIPRFREMIRSRFEEHDKQYAMERDWERRRQEHFEEKKAKTKMVQNTDRNPNLAQFVLKLQKARPAHMLPNMFHMCIQ